MPSNIYMKLCAAHIVRKFLVLIAQHCDDAQTVPREGELHGHCSSCKVRLRGPPLEQRYLAQFPADEREGSSSVEWQTSTWTP
jgi:hypothetical protein